MITVVKAFERFRENRWNAVRTLDDLGRDRGYRARLNRDMSRAPPRSSRSAGFYHGPSLPRGALA
jgi:hypothetical protein